MLTRARCCVASGTQKKEAKISVNHTDVTKEEFTGLIFLPSKRSKAELFFTECNIPGFQILRPAWGCWLPMRQIPSNTQISTIFVTGNQAWEF